MLHILYGEDDFTLHETLKRMKEEWGDAESLATNTSVWDAADVDPEQLGSVCNTMPFLAPRRLVIVKGLLGTYERGDSGKKPRKSDASKWLPLADSVKTMPESTELVLIDGKVTKENPLFPVLSAVADVREFKLPKGNELNQWIAARARGTGCSISSGAVRLLADLVTGDLRVLANEIDKLCLYAGDREITEEDVRLLVAEARDANVFAMVDCILARRATGAVQLLHALEAEGAAPPYLLFMITRQFRMVVLAKDMMGRRAQDADIARALGIPRGFPLQKTKEQARKHTAERLAAIYGRLLQADLSIKTGRLRGDTKGELALDLLVADLCA